MEPAAWNTMAPAIGNRFQMTMSMMSVPARTVDVVDDILSMSTIL